MSDLFLVFVDRNFFIQHSFQRFLHDWNIGSFSNQALDWTQRWKTGHRFKQPLSNVPTDKLHLISCDDFWTKRCGLSVSV